MYIAKTATTCIFNKLHHELFFPQVTLKMADDSVLQTDNNSNGGSNYGH